MAPEPLVASTFEAFYDQHRARLVAALSASARCGADAATEAVDEAFVRALARWGRVSGMDAPAGWVFTVARNQLTRTRSRRSREDELLRRDTGRPVVSAIDPLLEIRWALWDAVAALPERERTAVALRYIGDLPERDVAEAMGIAIGTVSATLHSARQKLAVALAEPGPPDPGPVEPRRPSPSDPNQEVTRDA